MSAFVLRPETGVAQGFDVYDATFPAMAADRSAAQVQRAGPQTLAAAEGWLTSLTSDRFFLFLHLYEPHKPYRAPDRFADLAAYDGEVAFADEIVGRLFAQSQDTGLVRYGDDRRARGSRRGPRRPHRRRARAVPLRRGHPRAVDHAAAARAVGRTPRDRSGAAHRPAADARGAHRAHGSARACAAAICRSRSSVAAACRHRASMPRPSIRAITSGGASSCR